MTTCLTCTHWLTKKTDSKLARMGFAQCEKKRTGHMTSSRAEACEKYAPVDDKTAEKRRAWDADK